MKKLPLAKGRLTRVENGQSEPISMKHSPAAKSRQLKILKFIFSLVALSQRASQAGLICIGWNLSENLILYQQLQMFSSLRVETHHEMQTLAGTYTLKK